MADEKVKVTDLATATTPMGTEYIPVSQGGVLRKLTLSDLPIQTALVPPTSTYGGNTAYDIPAGSLLEKVVIIPTARDITVKIGTTSGGNDILFNTLIPNGGSLVASIDVYSDSGSPKTVYISGITGTTKVIFYKR